MQDTKDYILKNMKRDFNEVNINGFYLIPMDEESGYEGYNSIHIIGYSQDENNEKVYYDFGDQHDVISLINFGRSGVSIDVEHDNGLVRFFWNDHKTRKISNIDAFLTAFTVYGEEL